LSAGILGLVMSVASGYPGTMAYAQSEPAVIIGLIATSLAANLHAAAHDDQILPTVLAAIMVGSLACGGFFLSLGYFRLGNLIRYIPFPVMGGFLAGIGWLLLKAALSSMAGFAVHYDNLIRLIDLSVLQKWLPGVLVGGALWALQQRRAQASNLPVVLGLATVLFWLVAVASGASQDQLQSQGWLLGALPEGGIWQPLQHVAAFQNAAWEMFPSRVVEFVTLAVMTAVALLLNGSAIELATRRDLDLNRELKYAGLANLLCGAAGSLPGYYALSASTLTYRMKTPIRFVGIATSLVTLLALFAGTQVIAYVPKLVAGALITYMGLGFLVEWLYGSWLRMGRGDFLVLILVFATVVAAGFMEAIGLGTGAGAALFVVRYSKIGVTRNVLSGATYHSNVDRAEPQRTKLREVGDQIFILRLQGFVFFGTANALVSVVRTRLEVSDLPLRYLVFDFSLVTGMDASAAVSFTKLSQYADEKNFAIVLCSPSDTILTLLRKEGITASAKHDVCVFMDLDHGLEWAENDLLARHEQASPGEAASFGAQVRAIFPKVEEAQRFQSYFETMAYGLGDELIQQGAASDDIFFIESGRVAIMLELPTGRSIRLKSMGAGTVVGEIAFYLGVPRSASVVALEETTAYRLSAAQLHAMHREVPGLATVFHEYMAKVLSARLMETSRLVGALNH
jgi:SulP family sulfate permease